MIIQNVHINTLCAAVRKRPRVILLLDQTADSRNNHGPREDGLHVSSGHLEHDAHVGGDSDYETGSSFYAAASFVCLWVILWYFKFCRQELVLIANHNGCSLNVPSIIGVKWTYLTKWLLVVKMRWLGVRTNEVQFLASSRELA